MVQPLPQNTRLRKEAICPDGRFEIRQHVRAGAFGIVYRAINHEPSPDEPAEVVIKEYAPADWVRRAGGNENPYQLVLREGLGDETAAHEADARESFLKEARLLRRLRSKFVPRYFDAWAEPETGNLYCAMEDLGDVTLESVMRAALSWDEIRQIAIQC